jgi:hypothetical protein
MPDKCEKKLPPTPFARRAESPRAAKTFSQETYAQLLEEENEQLRLRNQELQRMVKTLERRIGMGEEDKRLSTKEIERHGEALKRRDEMVAQIADSIISEFQHYKDVVAAEASTEEITVSYSTFDHDSVADNLEWA